MAAIFPPLIVTLTRIVPPNPVPLPSYVPSLYPSAGTLATGVCVVPCPAALALLFADSETVLVPELFFAAVFFALFFDELFFFVVLFFSAVAVVLSETVFSFSYPRYFSSSEADITVVSACPTASVSPSEPFAFMPENTSAAITAAAGTSLVQGIFGVFFSSCFLSFRSFSMLPYSLLFSCGLCQTLLFRNQQTSAADIALCLRQRLLDICDHIRFNSKII